jgi:hypothetical protein
MEGSQMKSIFIVFTFLATFAMAQMQLPVTKISEKAPPSGLSTQMLKKINQLVDNTAKTVKFTYSVATNGGGIGAHLLQAKLPAKAVITRSYLRIDTQFVDGGTGTVALSCEDANNIKTATDITGSSAGAFIEGQSTGAASAFSSSIAAECQVTATVAGAAQTDGKLTGWVEYVVHE